MRPDSALRRVETLVLGGGPAGAAAAIRLAESGRPVELWERELVPGHRNPGDLLGAAALAHLADLGIDAAALGAAPIGRLRLLVGDRVVTARLELPSLGRPFLGQPFLGLTRRLLDTALLQRAEEAGAVVRRGVAARAFTPDGEAEAVRERVKAAHLLLATGRPPGCLAGRPSGRPSGRPFGPGEDDGEERLYGFRWIFRLAPEARADLANHLELALWPHGRAVLHPVERDGASLAILVGRALWARCDGSAEALLDLAAAAAPPLRQRLRAAVPLLDRPLAIETGTRTLPPRPDRSRRAIWELGDVAASAPGFPGDGIGLALHGARLASAAILTGADQLHYGRRLRRDIAWPWLLHPLARRLMEEGGWQRRAVAAVRWMPLLAPVAFSATRLRASAVRRARLS